MTSCEKHTKKINNTWICFTFSIICLFYAYEFFLRISPSILVAQLLQQYQTSPVGIASFASSYFLGYLLMQIPAGLLFDHYPFKNILILALLTCVLGALIFTLEHHFLIGLLGRFLLGCGSAFAFIGAITFLRSYFDKQYFSVLISFVISIGTISAAFGQVFAVKIIHVISWHLTIDGMAIWGCILALALFIVPKKVFNKQSSEQIKKISMAEELGLLIKNKLLWINALIGGILYFPTSVIAATWGVEFFSKVFQLNEITGSISVAFLFGGWAIGGPVWGFLASRYRNDYIILTLCAISSAFILLLILMLHKLTSGNLFFLLFIFGVSSSSQILVWRIFNKLISDDNLTGTASSLTNLIIMLTVALGDLFLGALINFFGNNAYTKFHVLSALDLRASFYILPILLISVPLLLILIRKKLK